MKEPKIPTFLSLPHLPEGTEKPLSTLSSTSCSPTPTSYRKPVKKMPQGQLQSWGHFLCKKPVSTHSTSSLVIAMCMIALGLPLKGNTKADAMYRAPPGQDWRTSCTHGLGDRCFIERFPTNPVTMTRNVAAINLPTIAQLYSTRVYWALTGCKALWLAPRGKINTQQSRIIHLTEIQCEPQIF